MRRGLLYVVFTLGELGLLAPRLDFFKIQLECHFIMFVGTLWDGLVGRTINVASTVCEFLFRLGTWSHVLLFRGCWLHMFLNRLDIYTSTSDERRFCGVGAPYLQVQCGIQSRHGRLKTPKGYDQVGFCRHIFQDMIAVLIPSGEMCMEFEFEANLKSW
jgi:hypothetical protein